MTADRTRRSSPQRVKVGSSFKLPLIGLLLIALNQLEAAWALEVVEIDAQLYQDRPAIRVAFDGYLNRKQGFPVYLSVSEPGRGHVPGTWILSRLGDAVYFPNVRPGGHYYIQVAAGLQGLDDTRLSHPVNARIEVSDTLAYLPANSDGPAFVKYHMVAPSHALEGDEFVLELQLTNLESQSQQIHAAINAEYPLTLIDGAFDDYLGLAPNGHLRLRIPVRVDGRAGTGKIHLTLSQGNHTRRSTERVRVKPSQRWRRYHQRGSLEPGVRQLIRHEAATRLGIHNFDAALNLSAWPPVDKRRQQRLLENIIPVDTLDRLSFHAGQLHQSGSAAAGAAFTFGLEALATANDSWIRVHAAELVLGAIGDQHPKARTAALLALEEIIAAERVTPQNPDADVLHATLASQAYAAYVLARYGDLSVDTMLRLYNKQRRYALAGLPLIHLGLALHQLGDLRRSGRAILEGVSRERSPDPLGDHGSDVRDAALTVALLGDHGIAHKYRAPLIELMDKALSQSRRLSAPERLALIRAADAIGQVGTQPWQAVVTVDEFSEHLEESEIHTRPITQASLAAGTELSNLGDQTLYWSLDMEGYDKATHPSPGPNSSAPAGARFWSREEQVLVDEHLTVSTGDILQVEIAIPTFSEARSLRLEERKPSGFDWWFNSNDGVRVTGLGEVPYRQLVDRLVALLEVPANQSSILSYAIQARYPGDYLAPETVLTDTRTGEPLRIRSRIKKVRISENPD